MVRKAFTLLELLVTIAIIGILLAVVLSTLRYSKYCAQSVVCSSNIRQLTVMMNSYSFLQTRYPPGFCDLPDCMCSINPPGGNLGDPVRDWAGWWWFHFLMNSENDCSEIEKIRQCPSSLANNNSKLSQLCGNYGVNYSICKIADTISNTDFLGLPLKPDAIRNPTQVLLLADSGYSLISWKAATLDPAYSFEISLRKNTFYVPGLSINSQKSIYSTLEADAIKGRHIKKTINAGFVDGSLRKLWAESLLISTDTPSESPAYLIWSPSLRK
jgi:prepilin-type N-terminal cleavage/methylation domain-containing protein